jgi:predicted Zn-dependent peptidase
VAEARRLRAQEQAAQQGDVQLLVEKGLAAEADGKVGLAKVYYEMAARRATGPLKGQVDARLSDLGKAESPGKAESGRRRADEGL